jgi:riboflavin kinase/FMN adenylyltransferase
MMSGTLVIGSFDGIHLGHSEVVREALRRDSEAAVVCFEPIPRQRFGFPEWNRRLTTPLERISRLGDLGVGSVEALCFDQRMSEKDPEQFLSELAGKGHVERIVVGYDYHFGRGRSGGIETLKSWCRRRGIEVVIVGPVMLEERPVKSERIRTLVDEGMLGEVTKLLGRRYSALGPVCRGKGVGKRIGFPTMNLRVPRCKLLPPEGSYAGLWEGSPVAVFVPRTRKGLVEAHSPQGLRLPYGSVAEIEFVEFLREPESGLDDDRLAELIKNDVNRVMEVIEG